MTIIESRGEHRRSKSRNPYNSSPTLSKLSQVGQKFDPWYWRSRRSSKASSTESSSNTTIEKIYSGDPRDKPVVTMLENDAQNRDFAGLRASTRFRNLYEKSNKIIVCPGVYDGLSARIAIEIGFKGMYMTGAGTTASRLGMADLGIAQLHDMRDNAEMMANLAPDGPPLICDMDTGFGGGGPIVIDRAVSQYILAGVAGFHIEDQILQKRCGHLAGKEVVDGDEFIQRIHAAKGAARRLRSDIVIIARTDALQARGYAECISRLRRARDAGADMGILEGLTTKQQAAQAVKDMYPWPLCLNSVENGVSPRITVQEAQDMGFKVMIFSFAGVFPAYVAIKNTFERLRDEGITGIGPEVTPKTIFNVCGLGEAMVIDKNAGGSAFAKGV